MKNLKLYLAITAMVATLLMGCNRGSLRCNYSSADVSTIADEHVTLAGFAARSGLSTTIHIPIKSHCLVVESATDKICIISNDMMEISPELTTQMRTEISERTGLPFDHVLMHCIHTHSAPRTGGTASQPGGTNHNYKTRTISTIVENAVRTINDEKAFRKFRIETAVATTSINGNRCEKEGPVDHNVYVARLKATDGTPIVSILNLACHPVCMGPRSMYVSSDYAGVAFGELSKVWGGDVMQFTGAAGNMDPSRGPKDVAYAEECGHSLADSLVNVRFTKVGERNTLRFSHNTAELPYRIDKITPEAVKAHADEIYNWDISSTWKDDVRGWEQQILNRFAEEEIPNRLAFDMSAVNIDGVVFFFSQGEPFVEYQMGTRSEFPDQTIFFAGYTNGQNSYLPSQRAFERHKGYEYELDQMHIYVKAPYPLSDTMPQIYSEAIAKTISEVID